MTSRCHTSLRLAGTALRRFIVLTVGAAAVACGAVAEPVGSELVVPWRGALQCADAAQLATMRAELWIGGYTDGCALSVNPVTLSASGTCPDIVVGIVRPLLLRYALPATEAQPTTPLAYLVSYVDLRLDTLEGDSASVRVDLAEGDGAQLVATENDVVALPTVEVANASTPAEQLNNARVWARALLHSFRDDLDRDDDLCSNLREACAGSLFAPVLQSCPSAP